MSDQPYKNLDSPDLRALRWSIQESLDGQLEPDELAELHALRRDSPALDSLARGFESLDAALAAPTPAPPLALHRLIMARVEAFRQREALYQRSSLLLLAAAGLGISWLYGSALNDLGLSLTLLSWELILAASDAASDLNSLLSSSIASTSDSGLPLASLFLVPLFLALNALALPRFESLASETPLS
jgi:hypothetical protein